MNRFAGSVRRLGGRAASAAGFTLIEILVVVLILGILAGIAIPTFLSQTDKAQDADAKAEARTARTAIEVYETDNDGSYAGAGPDDLVEIEPVLAAAVDESRLTVTADADGYTIQVDSRNDPATQHFRIIRQEGAGTLFSCDVPETDGCPAGGDWGN